MPVGSLPPPPIQDKPGSYTWLEWYRQLRAYVSTSGSVPWYVINFAGSTLTDIAIRLHNTLQGIQGGSAGERYHLTAAQHTALGVSPTHNSLTSIQGGTTDEYYHFTSAEHTGLSNLTSSTVGTWSPSFTNLTEVPGTGSVGKAASYTRIGNVVFYTIRITCTGTATTASTAGNTFCDLPVAASQDDAVTIANKTTKLSIGTGYLDSTNDRCYPCSWVATGNTIIISGKYEV